MKKYPKYKASGIDWFGDIPVGWDITKLKFLTSTITKGTTPSTVGKDFVDEGINYLKVESISDVGTILPEKCSYIDKETHKILNRSQLKERDIVISIAGAIGRVAIISKDILPANTNQAVGIIRLRKKFDNQKWITYLLNSEPILNHYKLEVVETAQANLSLENVGTVELTNPPLHEQYAIVRFLDYKTEQIDSFIANRQKQIELLKEQKAGVINKAVTKGINPNAKMKDSGIEWIGEVPEHWEIWKTKFLCKKVSTGNTPSSNELKYYENGTINWFTPGDFKDDFKMENSQRKVTEVAIEEKECKLFSPYSTYVIGIGATLGKVRMSETTSSANQQINILEFNKKVVPAFGFFYFYSIEKTIIANANLSTMGIINQTKMKSLEMTLPPIDEQSAILNYINNENLTFDSLISKYQKQIDLMQEYRTSLISQAVTGKIDVREWHPKKAVTA